MKKIKAGRVFIFLFLTFSLSWGYDWLIIHFVGIDPYLALGMSPWGMLVPAFVALCLRMFVLKDSPIYFRTYTENPRWILYGFLMLTFFYAALIWTAVIIPDQRRLLQGIGALLFTLWTLLIFFVYGQSGKPSFERAGLGLGNLKLGPRFIAGIVFFFLAQAVFNLLSGLGESTGQAGRIYSLPIPSVLYVPSIIVIFVLVTVIGIPLSGLAGVFGEEYGWRGFLLSELIKIGKIRAAVLIGLIWGVWHFPIILRGIHTYPSSITGLFLGTIFFVLWGVLQGYAVIKTGSIWIAAFMHGVVNSVHSFSLIYIVKPESKIFSFGLGIYGLMCLGIVVYFVLKDPVWRSKVGTMEYQSA